MTNITVVETEDEFIELAEQGVDMTVVINADEYPQIELYAPDGYDIRGLSEAVLIKKLCEKSNINFELTKTV